MAGPENTLKKSLLRIMGTRWDAQSHEDSLSIGIPDLSYGIKGINGWIELKRVLEWPRKSTTKVKMSHLTPNQVNWLRKRGRHGGNCWLLVQVATESYLFSFSSVRAVRAGLTREEFREQCFQYWDGLPDPDELIEILVDGCG